MSGNRVEELESQVKALQATVDGLTDELVECKVRIQELEDAVDADLGPQSTAETVAQKTEAQAAEAAAESAQESTEDEAEAEADNTDAADDESTDSDSEIIVA